ncbi:MAG: OmpA family protein, partial [Sandaracinaceae bacterium]
FRSACDYCPNEPETYNGFEDVDGCPDAPHVSITSSMRIQIIERIYFRRGSSTIEPHNAPVLDTIAQVMNEQPSIRLVELVGGASQDERHPESLSRRRAEAVMQALIDRGVDPARLRVRAAGTREPVAAPGEPGTAELNRYVVPQLIDVEPSPEPLPQEPAPGPCPGGPPPPTASVCP